MGCPRIELYTRFDHCPTEAQRSEFKALFKRCAAHEPVAYLTGKASFYSLEFAVTPDVLIPRPETEELVLHALDYLRAECHSEIPHVLELGTGSGCIAVTLAKNHATAEILTVDISPAVLQVAQKNCRKHQCDDRVTLVESDLFAALNAGQYQFDLIVSNPPYVSDAAFIELEPIVRDYEPVSALRAGVDGMAVIRRIIDESPEFLRPAGALLLEIAHDQAEAVTTLMQESGHLTNIRIHKDSFGHERFIAGHRLPA